MARLKRAVLALVLGTTVLSCRKTDGPREREFKDVSFPAVVYAARSAQIVAPADGLLESLEVREGNVVRKGAPLARLSADELRRDLEAARARVAAAAARARSLEAERAARERDEASRASRAASAERALSVVSRNKQRKLERYRMLLETRDVSRQELEDAENEYAQALRDEELSRATIRRDSAAAAEQLAAEADLAQALSDAERLAARVEALEVRAPIPGTVMNLKALAGTRLFVRDAIAEIVDLETVEVRGVVPPELSQLFRPGMKVEVKVLTVPPQTFRTTVSLLLPAQGAGAGDRGQTAVVVLPNPDRSLSPNDKARIGASF